MSTPKGWHLLLNAVLPPIVTIRDLTTATHLSRRSIRDLVELNGIAPVPGHGPHGALSYELSDILTAAADCPGKGNRRSKQATR